MIGSPEDLFKDLLQLCPEFSATWQDEAYMWTDEDGTFTHCGMFAAFSHHIADILKSSEPPQLVSVFQYVENCMNDTDEVSTAAATCFLENLMNRTPGLLDPRHFVPLLGPESKEYCRAWDEFCGVRTVGLW